MPACLPRACVHSVDWYMVAQKALKGTARPTHYHILQADFGTPAELQQLTFDLSPAERPCRKNGHLDAASLGADAAHNFVLHVDQLRAVSR
jgi:hypothetical protein